MSSPEPKTGNKTEYLRAGKFRIDPHQWDDVREAMMASAVNHTKRDELDVNKALRVIVGLMLEIEDLRNDMARHHELYHYD